MPDPPDPNSTRLPRAAAVQVTILEDHADCARPLRSAMWADDLLGTVPMVYFNESCNEVFISRDAYCDAHPDRDANAPCIPATPGLPAPGSAETVRAVSEASNLCPV